MIKLINKEEKDGIHEEIWMLTLFHVEPTTFFKTIRNKSQFEVVKESRSERSQIIISAVGKYLSLESSNGLHKDFAHTEAVNRLTSLYDHISGQRENITSNCDLILQMRSVFKTIAREGSQYVYYHVLMNMAKEQLDYETELKKIEND